VFVCSSIGYHLCDIILIYRNPSFNLTGSPQTKGEQFEVKLYIFMIYQICMYFGYSWETGKSFSSEWWCIIRFVFYYNYLFVVTGDLLDVDSATHPLIQLRQIFWDLPDILRMLDRWLGKLPHLRKIVIAGNHDRCCQELKPEKIQKILRNCTYLQGDPLFEISWYFRQPNWSDGAYSIWVSLQFNRRIE
jgi:hypothetical protein